MRRNLSPETKNFRCWVAGWGTVKGTDPAMLNPYIRKVDIPLFDTDECTKLVGAEVRKVSSAFPNFKIHPSEICAGGEEGRDACNGDGGAPLVRYLVFL